jgi:hypothetical protein
MILTALSLALSGEKRVYQSGASAFFFADLERRASPQGRERLAQPEIGDLRLTRFCCKS